MNEHTAQQSIYSLRGVQSKWRQWLPLSPSLRVTLTPEEAEGPQVMPAPGGQGVLVGAQAGACRKLSCSGQWTVSSQVRMAREDRTRL